MDTALYGQILDETASISYRANAIGNGKNQIILLPPTGKE